MKKLILSFLLISLAIGNTMAQSSSTSVIKHSRDFLVIDLTYDSWTGAPDSIKTGGFSHGMNVAFTYDFPLHDDSHFSVAPGVGFSASHISFDNQKPLINGTSSTLHFNPDSSYKKSKLINTYFEIPIELRYRTFPDNANTGFKAGLGLKFGTLLDAHTKAKKSVNGYKQTEKIKIKQYFEKWRVAGTLRAGYGHFSAFASYSLTPLLQPTAGPKIRPLSVGITISGF